MDSNLSNSEIEKDLRKLLGIGIPTSRTSQDNANRNMNSQQAGGYGGLGGEKDHFKRETSDHPRRRSDPAALHGSPRGQRSWWDHQHLATSGSSPRAHNLNRNSNYSRSPKNWHDSSHEFGPVHGPSRDGRVVENSGGHSHRSRGGVQGRTNDTKREELNTTNHESWPELGSEGVVKNHKIASPKPKVENEATGTGNKNKPVASDVLEDNRPPPEDLERLAKEHIHPLRKRHSKFPKAMFFCRLCEYHCDTVPICNRHVRESRHIKNKSIRELEITLRNLPPPTEAHTEVLSDLLHNLHEQLALTDDEMKERHQFVKDLNVEIHKKLPSCQLRLYGSSMTGIGSKDADVNIDLVVSDKENPAKILMTVFDTLKSNAGLTDVHNDFGAKIPAIHFLEEKSNLKCVVSLNNLTSYKTTCLLTEYAKIDPRVRILGVVFRHWAKLCLIDRQTMGTLPSYSYILMLVYFLQQHGPPVLPVLHEMAKKPEEEYLKAEEVHQHWQTLNKQSVGALWVELFKFYSVSYKMTDFVISLRQWKPVTRSEKNWSTKKLALEDPYSPKRNLARFISNQVLFDYILERFKMTYKYFGIPQTAKGPLFKKLLSDNEGNEGFSDNKVTDASGKKFLEVLDNISKRTRENKLLQKNEGNNTKEDDDDDDNALIVSVSELKKLTKQNLGKSAVNTNESFHTDVAAVLIGAAATENTNSSASSKEASKTAKNGKNLAKKLDIDGHFEQSENKSSCRPNSRSLHSGPNENVLLSNCLPLSTLQDDVDSEDLSETSPPVVDDDSEQENCIPASLMEALDDDVDVSSLSGAEGSDNHASLVGNNNMELNGDLIDDLHSLDGNDNDSEVTSARIDTELETMKASENLKRQRSHSGGTDPEVSSLKAGTTPSAACSTGSECAEKAEDIGNSKENDDSSPRNKRSKTPKIPEELAIQIKSLQKEDFCFQFKDVHFTGGKSPAVFCSVCQKEGHLKQECPEEKLPAILPLPRMEGKFMTAIDQACFEIYTDNCPRDYETAERLAILHDLQGFIQYHLYPDARLELFGSSCNGFGFAHSDMDICLTFTNNKTGEDLKCVPIIESLTEKLKKHKNLYNVIPITTAKVPIVKFTHRPSRLEGDISLYNTLAQHNTRMLLLYSELDIRVKILGYTMKFFAKCCDIGDASRGSLSSYAYILMVIYFLQQRQPPVIPVLQELYDTRKPAPTRIVDGWNAWFLDDIKKVQKMWPQFGRNRETVGELWLGLLRYYTEEFNFQDAVISIRQLKTLTRFEKLWNSKCIAIEDPFDLQHNLGAGVSRKMNSYIMKAFIKGRFLFGSPIRLLPYRYRTLKEYLFCPAELTDGAPPNDRGCRLCGKIGHMVKDCPRKRPHNRGGENAGGKDQTKDHSRESVQTQSNDLHRVQTKEPNRDQTRDNQRPSREKKGEPFLVEKMMMSPQTSQVFSLPNSLQFNNSMLAGQSPRNALLPHPLIGVPFNRNGPQPRPSLHNGQFPGNLPMTQPHPHQITGMRLGATQPTPPRNIPQDETPAPIRTKSSSSMPNLALPCGMAPLLTQPTSQPLAISLDTASSSSKIKNDSSVKSSMQPHALPDSVVTTAESATPKQYLKAITQVSSTVTQEKVLEQHNLKSTTGAKRSNVPPASHSRNVILEQSARKLSNPSPSTGHSNAKAPNSISGYISSEELLEAKGNVSLNETANPQNLSRSISELTCAKQESTEVIKNWPARGSTPLNLTELHHLTELMKDRPTMGAPTTVFTVDGVKTSTTTSSMHLPDKAQLVNVQNSGTSSSTSHPKQVAASQPSVDNVPTSLGQHPPSFSAPPGFMHVNYRMPLPQQQFSSERSAPFNTLYEQQTRRARPPPPPPGIPVATSYSPVFISPAETSTGLTAARQPNPAQQFSSNVHSPLSQPVQQFTQYPGLFHHYPPQYFSLGLPSFPNPACGQRPQQQQLQQQQGHLVQNLSGSPSPTLSPQMTLQDHPTQASLSIRSSSEALPAQTAGQTRPIGTHESSPIPGNPFPSSLERPTDNILLNAMGLIRPNPSRDNQWLQLNVAANTHSQTLLTDTSHSSSGGGPLSQNTQFSFAEHESE